MPSRTPTGPSAAALLAVLAFACASLVSASSSGSPSVRGWRRSLLPQSYRRGPLPQTSPLSPTSLPTSKLRAATVPYASADLDLAADSDCVLSSGKGGNNGGLEPISIKVEQRSVASEWKEKISCFLEDFWEGAKKSVVFGETWRRYALNVLILALVNAGVIGVLRSSVIPLSVQTNIRSAVMFLLAKPAGLVVSIVGRWNTLFLSGILRIPKEDAFVDIGGTVCRKQLDPESVSQWKRIVVRCLLNSVSSTFVYARIWPSVIRKIIARVAPKDAQPMEINDTDAALWISIFVLQPLASVCSGVVQIDSSTTIVKAVRTPNGEIKVIALTPLEQLWQQLAVPFYLCGIRAKVVTIPMTEEYGLAGLLGHVCGGAAQSAAVNQLATGLLRSLVSGIARSQSVPTEEPPAA